MGILSEKGLRKATMNDFFGDDITFDEQSSNGCQYEKGPQQEKVLDYRKQKEYGQKKRIKP